MTATLAAPSREPVLTKITRSPALPAFVGALVIWLATWLVSGNGLWGTLAIGASVATYLVMVGIGQLFVITSGNGGIDLSVPFVMTISAYLGSQVMNGDDGNLVLGLIVAIAVGIGAGLVNALLVEVVGMPPLVGTLAVGFTIQTAILVFSSNSTGVPSPGLSSFVDGNWGPFPIFAIFGVLLTIVFAVLLKRTSYGRRTEAVGQSATAARLAGIDPRLVRAAAFVLSAALAGLAGILLAAHAGGPSLELGTPFQLESIAVVVLGGSLIAGGRGVVPGVWAGAMLLTLLVTLVNVAHVSSAVQNIVEGLLIVVVLAVARNPVFRKS
ncbi:ABC transporter permease [Pseudonocardia sp. RS11V-5]|uniref:ABC transporter permease n=1 Tax=Pseudonocardia terrae TaxID=2905831 RepID=UPI001E4D635B|nr:ABC transporter permease [Pseudonocardia terrae]MCE3551413.1 ABC transporter permease [Pseudonocardia terrae]